MIETLFCPWYCGFQCKTVKQLHRHIVDYPHEGIAMMVAKLVKELTDKTK